MGQRGLVVNACRSLCAWRASRAETDLYVCAGCGSQWVPSEPWTPIDSDGQVPPEVRAARKRQDRG